MQKKNETECMAKYFLRALTVRVEKLMCVTGRSRLQNITVIPATPLHKQKNNDVHAVPIFSDKTNNVNANAYMILKR